MIVNFYRATSMDLKNQRMTIPGLTSLNLEAVPAVGTYIIAGGQKFYVQKVELNTDTVEWNVYVVRA